ncbi:MAG: leucine-rich repeat domain-containing protein [Lachnospiraceae bacterium]|nr:leucine-rich repeat domain-containing protein [Lachnospiraceae bacterium]MEE3461196.1 leucine-rich repeat domain-containing protein [Lachnospiraceae bacterium]
MRKFFKKVHVLSVTAANVSKSLKTRTFARAAAVVLSAAMVFTSVPAGVSAAEGTDAAARTQSVTVETYVNQLDAAQKEIGILQKQIYKDVFEDGKKVPGLEDKTSVYAAYVLKKTGFEAPELYKAIISKLKGQFDELNKDNKTGAVSGASLTKTVYDANWNQTSETRNMTYENIKWQGTASDLYAKTVLFLTEAGEDASAFENTDLVALMTADDVYDASYYAYGNYGREGIVLQALNSNKNYKINAANKKLTSVDQLIDSLAKDVETQEASNYGIDGVAMNIVGFGNYSDNATAAAAVKSALTFLSEKQEKDGSYGKGYSGGYNYNTQGEVMLALGANNEGAFFNGKYNFIKEGKTLFDGALLNVDLKENKVNTNLEKGYGVYQLLEGLDALVKSTKANDWIVKAYYANKALTTSLSAVTKENEALSKSAVALTASAAALKTEIKNLTASKEALTAENNKFRASAVLPDKDSVLVSENASYKVTKSAAKVNVTYVGATGAAATAASVRVPDYIVINGVKCRVTKIAASAFKGNKNLKEVTVGKNVTEIGANTFSGCKSLKKVTLKGTSLTKVGKNAFKGTAKKIKITVPEKAKLKKLKKLFKKAGAKKAKFSKK